MKKYLSLFVVLTLFGININAQSADQTTLPVTHEEKLLEATIICLDAVEAPTIYNGFAKQFINIPSFPKKEKSISENEYKTKIKSWLLSNPLNIDKIVIARKKAHDQLYGYRPY